MPFIDGITFTKQDSHEEDRILYVGEISDDEYYTLALPERLLFRDFVRNVMHDYDIVQQIHLMFLFIDIFKKEG